jgi:hypothetical protein
MLTKDLTVLGIQCSINAYFGKHGKVDYSKIDIDSIRMKSYEKSSVVSKFQTMYTKDNGAILAFTGSTDSHDWEVNFDAQFDEENKDIKLKQRLLKTLGAILVWPYSMIKSIVDNKHKELLNPYGNSESERRIHNGFMDEYKEYLLDEARMFVDEAIENKVDYILIAGHSKGGAMATICYSDIQFYLTENYQHDGDNFLYGVFVSAPTVGNKVFVDDLAKRGGDNYQLLYILNDPVPAVPTFWMGYRKVKNRKAYISWFEIVQWPIVRLLWILSFPLSALSKGRLIAIPPLSVWDHLPQRVLKRAKKNSKTIVEKT